MLCRAYFTCVRWHTFGGDVHAERGEGKGRSAWAPAGQSTPRISQGEKSLPVRRDRWRGARPQGEYGHGGPYSGAFLLAELAIAQIVFGVFYKFSSSPESPFPNKGRLVRVSLSALPVWTLLGVILRDYWGKLWESWGVLEGRGVFGLGLGQRSRRQKAGSAAQCCSAI